MLYFILAHAISAGSVVGAVYAAQFLLTGKIS